MILREFPFGRLLFLGGLAVVNLRPNLNRLRKQKPRRLLSATKGIPATPQAGAKR